jgi:hypothetical protein
MNLNTLILQESEGIKISKDKIPFRWLTHHVSEIYINLLPKININNSSKIVIEFGAPGINEYVVDSVLGCSNIFIENFDFDKFYSLSTHERNLVLINEIKNNLISIYQRRNSNIQDVQSIISTADKVIETGFNLDIKISKLQKTTEDKTKKIEIHRILNSVVGEAWKCVVLNRKDSSIKEKWMTEVPDFLDRTDFFKKSKIQNNFYMIYGNTDRVTFKIEI